MVPAAPAAADAAARLQQQVRTGAEDHRAGRAHIRATRLPSFGETMVAELAQIPRKQAKTINLGMMYGMGVNKLADQLGRLYKQ